MVLVRPLDPAAIRLDFPLFERRFDGRGLAYLDSAATALKPRAVIEAVDGYHERYSANVHRGIYAIGEEATAAYEEARATIARFIGAGDAREIVQVRNATEAINLVAYSWGRGHVGSGDTIVLTELEHHANLVPWQVLAQERDADLEFVPIDEQGRLIQGSYEVLLRTRPKLVAFTHVSNGLGTINPAREMVEMAHAAGALVLLDGAQAVPHLPVSVAALGCDLYAFSGHKMLGPMGIGALVGKPALLDAMPPYQGGGEMIRTVHDATATYAPPPHKFEAGTPNVEGALGLAAAVAYLSALGMEAVAAHERALTSYALERLGGIDGLTLFGPAERAGVVSFTLGDIHPHDLATIVDSEGVAIRAGHHCAQPLMRRLDVAATARATFYVYNTPEDVDALAGALEKARALFGFAHA
jgi:cysteine desulfurase / selenocysteine lyase